MFKYNSIQVAPLEECETESPCHRSLDFGEHIPVENDKFDTSRLVRQAGRC